MIRDGDVSAHWELIRSNIARSGHHTNLISGGSAIPRYAYTIGLREALGAELILPGATYYSVARGGADHQHGRRARTQTRGHRVRRLT